MWRVVDQVSDHIIYFGLQGNCLARRGRLRVFHPRVIREAAVKAAGAATMSYGLDRRSIDPFNHSSWSFTVEAMLSGCSEPHYSMLEIPAVRGLISW